MVGWKLSMWVCCHDNLPTRTLTIKLLPPLCSLFILEISTYQASHSNVLSGIDPRPIDHRSFYLVQFFYFFSFTFIFIPGAHTRIAFKNTREIYSSCSFHSFCSCAMCVVIIYYSVSRKIFLINLNAFFLLKNVFIRRLILIFYVIIYLCDKIYQEFIYFRNYWKELCYD